MLTEDALRFVGALTFSALASEPARTSLFDGPEPIPHTRLGQTADLVDRRAGHRQAARQVRGRHLRRPAHRHAARHPGAGARGAGDAHRDVGAPGGAGEPRDAARAAACTWSTPSRAASPAVTSARAASPTRRASSPRPRACSRRGGDLAGVRVLVTAGGTREPIDPVRFIGNRSSGKMGYAIAEAAARRGRGRHARHHHRPARAARGVEIVPVADRRRRCRTRCSRAAPRADVDRDGRGGRRLPAQGGRRRASSRSTTGSPRSCSSRRTTSSSTSGATSAPARCSSGFAAETDDLVEQRGRRSCAAKRLDLIVGNDVSQPDAGFEVDTNRAVLLDADGGDRDAPVARQDPTLAEVILDRGRRACSDAEATSHEKAEHA